MAYPGQSSSLPTNQGNSDSLANTAADAVEEGRSAATDKLNSAADYISDKVGNMPGAETVQRTASAAADTMAATADYLSDTDVKRMAADVEALVKRNPGPALLCAAVVGFLIGRSLTSR